MSSEYESIDQYSKRASGIMCVRKLASHRTAIILFLLLSVTFLVVNHFRTAPSSPFRFSNQHHACRPKPSIVFLKTHKCASSTIQNIMFRQVENRGLSLMLPKDGNGNYIGHPMPFHRSMVLFPGESALDTKYEVHALHSRLDYNELKIMMRPNATFVTILRDPASLFESMYTYSELVKSYYLDLDTFAINAAAALNKSEFPGHYLTFDFSRRFSSGITGRNQMSFDLGLDSVFHDDELAIQGFIAHIDRVFDLVMISERMDESLVLLKHLLCLPMEDVVVFKHNSRRNEFKHQVDDYTNEKLKLVNHADTKLYEHFVSKFDERVKQFGHERMKKEVLKLKQLTDQMYAKCVEAEIEKPLGKFVFSDKTLSFEAKSSTGLTCKQLTLNELEYLDRLRTKMGTVKEFKMDVPK